MSEAFYERVAEQRYRATEHTRGPWDPDAQHAGPPTALLASMLEHTVQLPIARVTVEILRPVPIATFDVDTRVLRRGRSIQLAEATLIGEDGPLMLARAWGIRQANVLAAPILPNLPPLAPPSRGRPMPFFEVLADVGWHTAMEMSFLEGSGFAAPGPAKAWLRPRLPLIAGEPVQPLQRVMLAADAGNGVSAELDPARYLFVNTELTVHLHRHPVGDWVGLDAVSAYEASGVGLASTILHDARGPIGRGAQSLFVGPNPQASG